MEKMVAVNEPAWVGDNTVFLMSGDSILCVLHYLASLGFADLIFLIRSEFETPTNYQQTEIAHCLELIHLRTAKLGMRIQFEYQTYQM